MSPMTKRLIVLAMCVLGLLACAGLLMLSIGLAPGHHSTLIWVRNDTAKPLILMERVGEDGMWRGDDKAQLRPGQRSRRSVFYHAPSRRGAEYQLGAFDPSSPRTPVATIRLTEGQLNEVEDGRYELAVGDAGDAKASLTLKAPALGDRDHE